MILRAIAVSMRPRQWVKNVFVFAGLIFAQRLFTSSAWIALAAFAIFCGLSGAIYLINDVADRERDQLDPRKRTRPVAAGRLSAGAALAAAVVLVVGGLACAAILSRAFLMTACAYVVLLVAYSAWLKHIVIVDVIVVAGGFVLRAVAGAVVIDVAMSGWLLICTILLALFLTLGKRRYEYVALDQDAVRHRPILA
ncbi:MAG TPA: UbiA family prenyltransferase, partial [Methylomirabilota bacterium]|nr:UbiA family prenyltransferase [Methylomirabilota bacterium]